MKEPEKMETDDARSSKKGTNDLSMAPFPKAD
jgi:hypothetical protein